MVVLSFLLTIKPKNIIFNKKMLSLQNGTQNHKKTTNQQIIK